MIVKKMIARQEFFWETPTLLKFLLFSSSTTQTPIEPLLKKLEEFSLLWKLKTALKKEVD